MTQLDYRAGRPGRQIGSGGGPLAREGNNDARSRALAGRALQLKDRADPGGTLAHRAKTEVAGEVASRIEADAVVADLEAYPVAALGELDRDRAGAGVLDDV